MTVEERRVENCKRAELVFQDLKDSGVPLDVYILTTYMTGKMLSLSYHSNIKNMKIKKLFEFCNKLFLMWH